MRPDGAVVAMVGGRDYDASQFNRAVDASRHPGSAFKLFVYLAALRKGYSPQDSIDASPVDIKGWEPENYGNASYRRMTLAEAFARSVNTAAVRLAMTVGLDQVIAAARDLGIDSPLAPFPSLALGATGVNLLELTGAFASVRADRARLKPWAIAAIGPADGTLLSAGPVLSSPQTLGPPRQALLELLRGVVEHGTGRAAALNGFAAGKTGTSQKYRDAWFIGFNDALVVGVWLGNDDSSPMRRVVGGGLPASIWKQFMVEATPVAGQQSTAAAAAPVVSPSQQEPARAAGSPQQEPDRAAPPGETVGAARPDEKAATAKRESSATPANPARQTSSEQSRAGRCNVQACAAAYRSFRGSDCTYQPDSGGARRICEAGGREKSIDPNARGRAEQVSRETQRPRGTAERRQRDKEGSTVTEGHERPRDRDEWRRRYSVWGAREAEPVLPNRREWSFGNGQAPRDAERPQRGFGDWFFGASHQGDPRGGASYDEGEVRGGPPGPPTGFPGFR